ncbi:hypothetical protein HX021_03155 [Sphingobacterium sp. N143]|uniref:hypothetical protein n=1 Tax=Sphingobacterium sp. N143 TaxID=2746727 RepID=UPI002574BA99|nr:hypothetical protein [Sphingobacterium sp. N143]MDM1293289.1 hypothetical protein [Sphingobacterium sp. N143]
MVTTKNIGLILRDRMGKWSSYNIPLNKECRLNDKLVKSNELEGIFVLGSLATGMYIFSLYKNRFIDLMGKRIGMEEICEHFDQYKQSLI